MDPRSSGRQKVTTGNSKGVQRRGEGLGTGPVGRQDAYAGRKASSAGSRAAKVGGGSGTLMIIIIIVMMLLKGGGSGNIVSTVTDQTLPSTTTTNTSTSTSGINLGTNASATGNVNSLFGGFAANSSSAGWQNGFNNTSKLNRNVATTARPKRTKILGGGQDTVTIMVYMCGTDLESRSGMASNDLGEMAAANIPDNVNIIVYTGGCNGWKTGGISNKVNQIYRVRSGKLEQLVADDGDRAMTDPNTLTRFINFCSENYPANRQDLIFWDHGGGSITGYGYDEKHKNAGSMNISMIKSALSKSGQNFDFIGFDACLMATLETAFMSSEFADYLIASEETEPGIGWYYTKWLNALAEDTGMPTVEIGKNIVDGFIDECNRVCGGQKTTLSVIDLSEFSETVPSKLSAFASTVTDGVKNDGYQTFSDARAGAREFATSSKIDQIDLVNFLNTVNSNESKALSDVVLESVKYNRTSNSMTNAYGLSLYLPRNKANKVDTVVSINNDIGIDNEYNKCLKALAGVQTTGQVSAGGSGSALNSLLGASGTGSVTGGDAIGTLLNAFLSGGRDISGIDRDATQYMNDAEAFDIDNAVNYVANNQFDPSQMVWKTESDGTHTMNITADQWKLIQDLQVNMFVDDGTGYVDMGLDNFYSFTEDGKLIGDTDNTWFAIDGQPVAFYYEDTTELEDGSTIVQGRVPAYVDGVRCNLIIVFDDENPSGYIAGARYDYTDDLDEIGVSDESDMTVAKGVTEIADGAAIDFICDYYDYDGNYEDSYLLGDRISYSNSLILSYEDVGARTRITYLLTDIYNSEYWTPVVE